MSRITLPGSLFLALIAILPLSPALGQHQYLVCLLLRRHIAADYGGCGIGYGHRSTGHLKMREMDGLMKSGRIKGRTPRESGKQHLIEQSGVGKVILKTSEEIELIRISSLLVGDTHAEVAKIIRPGIKTRNWTSWPKRSSATTGLRRPLRGTAVFRRSLCISVNEAVVHGIPGNYEIKPGMW